MLELEWRKQDRVAWFAPCIFPVAAHMKILCRSGICLPWIHTKIPDRRAQQVFLQFYKNSCIYDAKYAEKRYAPVSVAIAPFPPFLVRVTIIVSLMSCGTSASAQ